VATSVGLSDVLEVRAYCNDQTQNGINVLHYAVTSIVGVPLTDQQIADVVSATLAGGYKPYMPAQANYAGITLQIVNPIPAPRVRSVIAAGPGAVAGDSLPPEVTLKVGTRAAVVGRRGRGRSFLPFWGESDNDINGRPNAGAQASASGWAALAYNTITTAVGANSVVISPIIWSKNFAPARNFVTSVQVPAVWTHMKRRSFANKSDVLGPPL